MIDFSQWKLTLPVDNVGGFDGVAREVKPLTADFDYPPYYEKVSDGIIFSAPTDGATTSGSHYPRCELREMINGKEAAWRPKLPGKLACTLKVLEVPTRSDNKPGRIVIGQIHGKSNELCRLYYDKGQLYFYDDKAGSSKKETKFVLKDADGNFTSIPIG